MQADQYLRDAVLELKDIDEAALVPSLTLEELDLDSLDYVEIQVGIKKNFGVTIDPELFSAGTLKTLGDVVRYVETQRAQAGQAAAAV